MRFRFVISTVIALGIAVNANSQVLIALIFGDKLNSPSLEFGLTAGLSLSTINNIPEAKYRSALNLGLYFDVRIKDNWWAWAQKTRHGTREPTIELSPAYRQRLADWESRTGCRHRAPFEPFAK